MTKNVLVLTLLLLVSFSSQAQVINFPDPVFKQALINLGHDTNSDGELEVSEAELIADLYLNNSGVSSIEGISNFTNLENLTLRDENLNEIRIENLSKLTYILLDDSSIPSVAFNNLPVLTNLSLRGNGISVAELNSLANLSTLNLRGNALTQITLADFPSLFSIDLQTNNLTEIDLTDLPSLFSLELQGNSLSEINLMNLPSLNNLQLSDNSLVTVELSALPALNTLSLGRNLISNYALSDMPELSSLVLISNELVALDLSNLPKLQLLSLNSNRLAELELNDLPSLNTLSVLYNPLVEFNLSELPLLQSITLGCCTTIPYLNLAEFENFALLEMLGGTTIEFLNIVNGEGIVDLQLYDDARIDVICVDQAEQNMVRLNHPNSLVHSFCFGGDELYSYKVQRKFLSNNNVCEEINYDSRFNLCFDDGTVEICHYFHGQGVSEIKVAKGPYSVALELSNDQVFSVNPDMAIADYTQDTSGIVQEFCFTPIGNQNDLQISLLLLEIPQAGFEAMYKLIYTNVGNTTMDGKIELNHQDYLMTYVSAVPTLDSTGVNELWWFFNDLKPFESKEINFTMLLNSPMDIPPLNNGDFLGLGAIIHPLADDVNTGDNYSSIRHEVFNSVDPNDKTCMEGPELLDDKIGAYLTYMIRFENTGTTEAINVIVVDTLDALSYEISSIKILDFSHPMQMKLIGNVVEFDFENIYLPFDDYNNDGYIAFKIKLKDNLSVGDQISNRASIYFDFNWPIVTNTARSEIVTDMDGDGFNNLHDCDDSNVDINPLAVEIANNDIDENCDGLVLYLDSDGDGFNFNEDCDDNNPNINPGVTEEAYNGLDDDCDASTLDDDLDQDGYLLVDDCDDTNPDINPAAEEILNNDIDEDCDGEANTSSTKDITDNGFNLFPNPVSDILYTEGHFEGSAILRAINGKIALQSYMRNSQLDVSAVPPGFYIIELHNANTKEVYLERIVIE